MEQRRSATFTLIRNVQVFAPQELGLRDVLVVGEQVVRVAPDLGAFASLPEVKTIEGGGRYLTPGFIDAHVHISGGGGGAGFGSRGPEINFSEAMLAGITTVLGCVGIDQEGRDLQSLLAKTRSLEFRGMTARMLTGGFDWRVTVTGSIIKDLFVIDHVVGAKVAISDRRSFHPTQDQLNQLIAETMHGGLLSGKAGIVQVHVGDLASGITPLMKAVKDTGVPIKHVLPTHLNRNEFLMEQAAEWINMGGVVDLTPAVTPAEFKRAMFSAKAIKKLLSAGCPIEQITLSSDANGISTIHGFDKVERFPLNLLHKEFKELVLGEGLKVSDALKCITSNVARVLKMERKGVVMEGADADLVLLDPGSLELELVMARGEVVVQNGKILKMQKLDV